MKNSWPNDRSNFDRNLAVVIGIDNYEGNKISKLSTPVGDAVALADLLQVKFGYDNVRRLMNAEANLAGLKKLLHETLPNQLKPTEYDRLIVYFAGHGLPKNSDEGPTGYLVPQDAQSGQEETFLPMVDVWDALEKLECHHLLIILDCCFAGQFRWASSRKLTVELETIHREHYDRFIRYPAWQVITSSAHDQEALDQVKLGQDNRGTEGNTKHSPFALALLEALGGGSADYTKDGVITSQELIVYLDERLAKLSNSGQVPGLYPLDRKYDKGQFIFVEPGFDPIKTLTPAPELNPENNPYRGLNSFEERHANFFFGREKLIDELYDRLVNSPNDCPLTAVLGVSGSGKSSLVKAGLVPKLREQSEKKWYILEPMRPGLSPFTELAKVFLPIINPELLTDLNQISFLDEKMKVILDTGSGIDNNLGNGKAVQVNNSEQNLERKDINIQQLPKNWCDATAEAKLLLILDYHEELKKFCQDSPEQHEFEKLYQNIDRTLQSVIDEDQAKSEFLKEKIVKWVKSHPQTKILLVVDQFEELITLVQNNLKANQSASDSAQSEEQKFLKFLNVILGECSQNLRVIVTLRSDFEPRFINSSLKDYWNNARFPVRAMSSDELREAITGPAEKQALSFQPDELVGQLVDEVGQMPGALPLLSFTLSELYIKLYERNKAGGLDRALQREDYEALGGVAGALTRRATEEYDNLLTDFGEESGKTYQATMRRLMLRMVSLEGGAIARRRVLDSELIYADEAENERVNAIKDRLVASRLLVKGQENGIAYVEPAHDFLVRGWDRLQEWIRGEQENLSLQQRLTVAAVEWQGQKQKESGQSLGIQGTVEPVINWFDRGLFTIENLVNQVPLKLGSIFQRFQNQQGQTKEKSVQFLWDSNPYLKVLDQELESDQHWLNAVETEFVKESVLQKRRSVSWRWRIAIAVILGLSGLTIFALNRQRSAEIQAIKASIESSEALMASNQTLDARIASLRAATRFKELSLATIWPEEKLKNQVRANLQRVVYEGQVRNRLEAHRGKVSAMAFSRNGQLIVTGGDVDATVRLWDTSGKMLHEFKGNTYKFERLMFTPDNKHILALDGGGIVRLWDTSGKLLHKLNVPGSSSQMAFSPDGEKIFSLEDDGFVHVRNTSGKLLHKFKAYEKKHGSPGMRLISSNYSLQKSYVEGVSQTTLFSKGIITIQFLA